MKMYESKSGAQNNATRLNKIESKNNTTKFWYVEMIVINNELKYIIQAEDTFGITITFGA